MFLDEGESLSAIKRNYQNPRNLEQSVFGSSSEEEEHEHEKMKRIGDAKIDSDDSEASVIVYFYLYNVLIF